jgi:hypothetical protein
VSAGYVVFGASISDAAAAYLSSHSHELAARFANAVTSRMTFEVWPATARQVLQPKQKIFTLEIENLKTHNLKEDIAIYEGALGPEYKFEVTYPEEEQQAAVRVAQDLDQVSPSTDKEKDLNEGWEYWATYNTPNASNYIGSKADAVKAKVEKVKEFVSEAAAASARKTVSIFSKARKLVNFWK